MVTWVLHWRMVSEPQLLIPVLTTLLLRPAAWDTPHLEYPLNMLHKTSCRHSYTMDQALRWGDQLGLLYLSNSIVLDIQVTHQHLVNYHQFLVFTLSRLLKIKPFQIPSPTNYGTVS